LSTRSQKNVNGFDKSGEGLVGLIGNLKKRVLIVLARGTTGCCG
jgi:hypothetical protein